MIFTYIFVYFCRFLMFIDVIDFFGNLFVDIIVKQIINIMHEVHSLYIVRICLYELFLANQIFQIGNFEFISMLFRLLTK